MSATETINFATWLTSLNPQVQGAVVSAVATVIGLAGTTIVGLAGFRHARRATEATLDGQRQRSIDERRFAVYEETVKYLLRLSRLRPENYNFWPEISGFPSPPEITHDEQANVEAQIVAWASDEIRELWEKMLEGDHGVDVGRQHLRILSGQTPFILAKSVSADDIEKAKDEINTQTHDAHRRRQATIEAIRKELIGARPSG